jgi:hypothetical protein
MSERFINQSFPDLLDTEKREAAVALLEEWLEQPAERIAAHMKEVPVTAGRLRRLAELLDVSATGLAGVLEAHRVTVSSRMLSSRLPDDAPVSMWAKKMILLGLFCGYYRARSGSTTWKQAKIELDRIRDEPNLEMRFRTSARMKHQGRPVGHFAMEAKRLLSELWPSATREVAAAGIDVEAGVPPVVSAKPVYPVATRWDGRLMAAHVRDGIGAKDVRDVNFSRFKREEDGDLVFRGNNRGAVFTRCVFPDVEMPCDLSGAAFIDCTFEDVMFTGSLADTRFINCKGTVTFWRQGGSEQLARAQFINTLLEVKQADYDMPEAYLLNSALMSERFMLGVAHPQGPSDSNILGLATGEPFADMCERAGEKRAAAFAGVRLNGSYIDLPVRFFAEALKDAMAYEDWEAWRSLPREGFEVRADGCVYGTGLMGDALDAKLFGQEE